MTYAAYLVDDSAPAMLKHAVLDCVPERRRARCLSPAQGPSDAHLLNRHRVYLKRGLEAMRKLGARYPKLLKELEAYLR